MPAKNPTTELRYYAAARDYGWAPGDEDTPQEFCKTEGLTKKDLAEVRVEFWRAEFEAWKAHR